MKRLASVDRIGQQIGKGDRVRIVGIPDLSDMTPRAHNESLPIFNYLQGKYKTIQDFNDRGCAELSFRIRKGKHRGLHTGWIEPFLLKKKRKRP